MSNVDMISNGITQIYRTRGEEAFSNSRLFHALLDDFVPELGNERRILRMVVDDATLQALFSIIVNDDANRQLESMRLKKKFEEINGLSEKWSYFIVECFAVTAGFHLEIDSEKNLNNEEKTPYFNNTPLEYTLEDGAKYKGVLVNGKPHGKGKKIWQNGATYIGDFINGKAHGFGTLAFADGSVYEGDFVEDKMTGKGKYTWAAGDIYEGDFAEDKMTGKGKRIWTNGDVYEGDYIEDKKTGNGKFIWADGDVYEGDFVEDKMTGKGKYTWADGDIYEGDFAEDKMTGKGKHIWTNGDVYEGDYIEDKKTGKGKLVWASGNIYEGDFVEDKMTGKGKCIWTNGDVYEGEYIEDKRTGKGKYIWANGDTYEGEFVDGKITGNGTMMKNGVIQKGYFEDGILKTTQEDTRKPSNELEADINKKRLLNTRKEALISELKSLGAFDIKRKKELRKQILDIEMELKSDKTDDHQSAGTEAIDGTDNRIKIMEIEDRFPISGRGTVLVGKLLCKRINMGDSVIVNEQKYVITAIEMNRKMLNYAEMGDEISILVKGLNKRDVESGDCVYIEV